MRPRALTAVLAAAVAAVPAAAGAASATAAQRPPPFAESGVLTVGARGPAVRALQRELRSRGIPVAVDGRFGPGTRRAVARLQKRLGLRINGIVDRSLLWWLGISVCDLPGPTTARGAATGHLRLGAFGPQVCVLQRSLVHGGFTVGVDGGFGPQTRAAVRSAQRRFGMRPTGVSGPSLLRRLRTGGAEPGQTGGATLEVGSRGARVRQLQVALLRKGFDVSVDGEFGPATRRALVRWQRRAGLQADGRATPVVLRRIGAGRPSRLVVFPVRGVHSFSDDFGAPRHQGKHEGNDILAPMGTPVVAVANGVIAVMTRKEKGLGGIWIWLRADDATGYYYAHLSHIAPGLAEGSRVRAGQVIGNVGMTGDARGTVPHLHFEIHPQGKGAIDPYPDLRAADSAAIQT
ncbi:MAG TPA: peptidoglycan-binding protein [Miltoncostaea sp.]|nr:peptidoglycan-binding protein [Miltoncostaea sp.]